MSAIPKHVADLAHELGVTTARLDLFVRAAKDLLSSLDGAPEGFELPESMDQIGFQLAVRDLRRAVDRAALPIESPEVPDAAS